MQTDTFYPNSKGLTGVVAIRACVWPLALAEAPHGAFVVVDTLFIDGIDVLLWGPQGPKGLLTVLTTVGSTRAWIREKKDRRKGVKEVGKKSEASAGYLRYRR